MEPFISDANGVWVKAQFIVNKRLQTMPRCLLLQDVLKPTDSNLLALDHVTVSCIAVCKKACLPSLMYNDVNNESTINPCSYRTTVIAEVQPVTDDLLDESGNNSGLSSSSVSPQENYLLFSCEQFLDNFGFYNKEIVWISVIRPLPLNKVIISPTIDNYTDQDIVELITQIYKQCQLYPCIVNTGYQYLHQPEPFEGTYGTPESPTNDDDASLPWMDNGDTPSDTSLASPIPYNVLETTPTLQGCITIDTSIVIVPYQATPPHYEEVINNNNSSGGENDNLFDLSTTPPTYMTPPSYLTYSRLRAISASDIQIEDSGHIDMSPFVEDQPISLPTAIVTTPPESLSFIIEARIGEIFPLSHHYVLLPKGIARKHNIWELQNILISCSSAKTIASDNTITRTVITLNNELKHERSDESLTLIGDITHKRLAIARLYETIDELQSLVPRVLLEYGYKRNDLNVAYIHPELLFNLCPETLCVKYRQYYVAIENMMATPSPSPSEFTRDNPPLLTSSITGKHLVTNKREKTDIKKMYLGSVATPTLIYSDEMVKELIQKHLIDSQTKVVINKGNVFSIATDSGRLVIRVIHISPPHHNGGISGDEFTYVGQFASYIPYLYYHSCPISYWQLALPAGLEEYTNKLFQYFLPNLMPKLSVSMSCATVLISGPPGTGKSTIIRSVAKRCRLNVKEYNCYDFFSEGLKAAEEKLRIAFDKALNLIPCVMVLKNINVLTKQDLSVTTSNHEPRLDTSFEQHVTNINQQLMTANFPFIIVGVSSSPKDVSPRIQHCFLHEIAMMPPTQEERARLIEGLTLEYPISRDIDVIDLARQSAGFVLGDYLELFSQAHKIATNDILLLMKKCLDINDNWIRNHHLSIFGTIIQQTHIDSALNHLHTSHSGYIGAPKIPNVKWRDVGGLEEAKKEILETIQLPLLHPELFVGDLRRSGILLYGAPGTGKTLLAKAVATECSLNFLSVKGPELINMYVGQTEENIREIFSRARGAAPCVVFFDELDSLAPNRGKSGDSGGVMDRVVSQLLAELDGLDQKKDVFVIGATNRPDLIDVALLRPGRFDRLVYLDVCDDVQSKLTILKAITRKFNLHEDVNLSSIAEECPSHLTGADLYALCADSMLSSLRQHINYLEQNGLSDDNWNNLLIVNKSDFMESLKTLKPSVSEQELEMYRKKQFLQ